AALAPYLAPSYNSPPCEAPMLYRRLPVTYNARPSLTLACVLGFWSLLIPLVLSSGPAYAEWIKIVDNDQTGITVYADPMTVRRNGNLVKGWLLYDFKTIQTKTYAAFLSFKALSEIDCAEERTRHFALTIFWRNMGPGEVVYPGEDKGKCSPFKQKSF